MIQFWVNVYSLKIGISTTVNSGSGMNSYDPRFPKSLFI